MKNRTFNVGDRVAMSAAWGKSTSADYHVMKRRGTVVRIDQALSSIAGPQFVSVAWDGEGPFVDYDGNPTDGKIVNSNNLAKVGSSAFGDTYA